jgi:hypothetical protein
MTQVNILKPLLFLNYSISSRKAKIVLTLDHDSAIGFLWVFGCSFRRREEEGEED